MPRVKVTDLFVEVDLCAESASSRKLPSQCLDHLDLYLDRHAETVAPCTVEHVVHPGDHHLLDEPHHLFDLPLRALHGQLVVPYKDRYRSGALTASFV